MQNPKRGKSVDDSQTPIENLPVSPMVLNQMNKVAIGPELLIQNGGKSPTMKSPQKNTFQSFSL
jgi:hypothetical protein